MSKTTIRNLRQKMSDLVSEDIEPVLNLETDPVTDERYLQLMAYHNESGTYIDSETTAIFNSGGKRKLIKSKTALIRFAKKYGFKPNNIAINGIK